MKILGIIAFPFSALYGLITTIRNFFFDKGIFKVHSYDMPIISVGNLSVGGTGKTPHIEYLIRLLSGNNNVATLSRGYGRKTSGFILADKSKEAFEIGDEPAQFVNKFDDISVAVDEKRPHGVEELLKLKPETDVILLDDAFQHRAIKPGFSILLTDYHKPYYKDYILPSGTLRESVAGANRADIIIVTKSPKVLSPLVKRYFEEKLKPLPHQKLYFSYIKYAKLKPFSTIAQALEKKCKINTILLFAGIANTYPLEDYLKKMCNNLELVSYSDHYNYQEKDLLQIENTFNHLLTKDKIIVTTEKDAMRLKEKSLKKIIDRLPVYYIPIKVTLHDNAEDEFNKLVTDYVEENKRNR